MPVIPPKRVSGPEKSNPCFHIFQHLEEVNIKINSYICILFPHLPLDGSLIIREVFASSLCRLRGPQ